MFILHTSSDKCVKKIKIPSTVKRNTTQEVCAALFRYFSNTAATSDCEGYIIIGQFISQANE